MDRRVLVGGTVRNCFLWSTVLFSKSIQKVATFLKEVSHAEVTVSGQ